MKSIWWVMAVVLGLLAPVGSAHAAEVKPEWGSVSAQDAALKAGCRNYRYRYEVTPPALGDWDLNVSLVAPGGRTIWFGYLSEGANPAAGTATYRLCRSKTPPGRYKLKAVVTNEHANDVESARLPTVRFRLRKP